LAAKAGSSRKPAESLAEARGREMPDWILARGYKYTGVHCGLRADPNRLDLALVVSDFPAAAAGVFTQNQVAAAPVQVCRQRLPSDSVRGFVVCSGNANACTGQQGLDDARRMCTVSAERIGCAENQMLVCSTGVIGQTLPMERIEDGIRKAASQLDSTARGLEQAARAIMTTDTQLKVSGRAFAADGVDYRVTGFAKGAAMIGPNMATMLAFVLTDAPLAGSYLAELARHAAGHTFNCISVEGHTSTNDTLLVLANGKGQHLKGDGLAHCREAVTDVCGDLARGVAADAEGATHLVKIEVQGLRTHGEAHRVAKVVAESALVKTAIFGADPNWGRIVSAAGYAGIHFQEKDLSLWLGELLLYAWGVPQAFDAKAASAYLKGNREIRIRLEFNVGAAECTFWTCDLGYDYIRLNADYTT
jgi:glutamate N-acetyltransferase/amino-acid N-acetyltransferase